MIRYKNRSDIIKSLNLHPGISDYKLVLALGGKPHSKNKKNSEFIQSHLQPQPVRVSRQKWLSAARSQLGSQLWKEWNNPEARKKRKKAWLKSPEGVAWLDNKITSRKKQREELIEQIKERGLKNDPCEVW